MQQRLLVQAAKMLWPAACLVTQMTGMSAQSQEAGLIEAAEMLWDDFAAAKGTQAAAERMLHLAKGNSLAASSCLGRTAWNAYSFNIDYRTGRLTSKDASSFLVAAMPLSLVI